VGFTVDKPDKTRGHTDSVERDELDTFTQLVRRWTPDEAERQLLKLGLGHEQVTRIRAAYNAEARRVRELRDPPGLIRGDNSDIAWYLGPADDDLFWPAAKQLIKAQGWTDEDVESLDLASTKVVARMAHPGLKRFTTRGLVVGHVQSGKTTNFISVIAKAADRDYRFFIVLSGIHNGLREQTQERLGEHLVDPNERYWMPLTGPGRDFIPPPNATVYLSTVGENRVLCVVKKNAARLRRLRDWLASANPEVLEQCPVLMIDDEADQASVATDRINGLIRDILNLLPKAAYVGYTATPFANLLIDPAAGDLYPSDFILDLPQPRNHFGTEVIFGRDAVEGEEGEGPLDGYDMVRTVPVDELPQLRPAPREPAEEFVPEITHSLRRAILYFWLATATRRIRCIGVRHSTMLIHTSMRIAVHESFKEPLDTFRAEVVRKLAANDRTLLEELRNIWRDETARVPASAFDETTVGFNELKTHLAEVVGATRVVMDNSRSRERLSYGEEPVVAIAVGGNTLSRGLTLEGLVVSYFVRSTSAYDTLLQMGRWFGYRRGYPDLPRVWMTDELRQWFRHLATVEEEIRRDIRRYEEENLTPEEFAVRIRTHPALTVTAASKMRDAIKAEASYGGKRCQTRYFYTDDAAWLQNNLAAARELVSDALEIDAAAAEPNGEGQIILRGVKVASITKFLGSYHFHPNSFELDSDLITRYIDRQNEAGQLREWNVALMGGERTSERDLDFGHDLEVKKIRRSQLIDSPVDYADIKTLMSKEHRVIDLPEITQREARHVHETELMQKRTADRPGLLALYPIDAHSEPDDQNKDTTRKALGAADDVIGVALVFPGGGAEAAVEYVSADLSRLGMSKADIEEPDDEDPEKEEIEAVA
jgi:hypothetical protein